METETKKIVVFCAHEQKETDHVVDIDGIGEIVLTCDCGRALKFPKGTTSEMLKEYIASHKVANEGQISQEAIDAEKEKLLADL